MIKRVNRTQQGAVLPFIVVATLLLVGFVAYAVDVTRNILAVQKLQFAAESAGLDAYARLLNSDGTVPGDRGLSNAQTAVANSHGSAPWNQAPLGPVSQSGPYNGGVTIDQSDVVFGQNPSDNTEPLLQVTARRAGNEALKFFFLPAIFAMNAMNGEAVPSDAQTASPYRTVEIVGAPATRIGAGAPRGAANPSSTAGWAALPIAISYSQFVAASNPANAQQQYQIELLNSTKPYVGAAAAGRIRGAFVNLSRTGSGSTYYGSGQGNPAISEMLNNWRYFGSAVNANEVAPAAVERGGQLAVFDEGDLNFQNRELSGEVQAVLRAVPTNRFYIVPVIDADPIVNSRRAVVGFALLRLDQSVDAANQVNMRFTLAASYPVRNASSVNTVSIPAPTGANMPPPIANGPFANRSFDAANNAISPRFRGVALAPVTSPRSL